MSFQIITLFCALFTALSVPADKEPTFVLKKASWSSTKSEIRFEANFPRFSSDVHTARFDSLTHAFEAEVNELEDILIEDLKAHADLDVSMCRAGHTTCNTTVHYLSADRLSFHTYKSTEPYCTNAMFRESIRCATIDLKTCQALKIKDLLIKDCDYQSVLAHIVKKIVTEDGARKTCQDLAIFEPNFYTHFNDFVVTENEIKLYLPTDGHNDCTLSLNNWISISMQELGPYLWVE
jgi:hypothetical protein